MKKTVLKIGCLFFALITLCSCGNKKMLKTKNISTDITQTSVILETDIESISEYNNFLSEFKSDFTIPGLLEGVIPQGICYDSGSKQFIISGYYNKEAHPSVIMLVDGESKKLSNYHTLQYVNSENFYGHVGGLACSDTHLFITNDNTCYVIDIASVINAEKSSPIKLKHSFKLNTKGSFATISNGIFWTGDFIESNDKEREKIETVTTLESGETLYAYCEGYILKDGLPDSAKINSETNGYIPDYMLAIPDQVQGMTFTNSGKIVFTTSYGRKNNSYIYVYEDILLSDKVGTYIIDSKSVDLLACSFDLLDKKITAPPMIEGATQGEKGIYFLFESGASKYRSNGGKHPTDKVYTTNIE